MLSLFLILRRTLRDAPLTLTVLFGLLVLVTLLVAAPLYMDAIEDVGLRATIAAAPLEQSGVRAVLGTTRLQQSEHVRLSREIEHAAQQAGWLKPTILTAISGQGLLLPGGYTQGRVSLVDTDAALDNLRVLEGRLPQRTDAAGGVTEVVLGTTAAEALALRLGDQAALIDQSRGETGVTIQVVGLVEPVDPAATFWQSELLSLQPNVSASRREASLVVAPGTLWSQVVPALSGGQASGEYRWRIVFDLQGVDKRNVLQAEADISRVVQQTSLVLDSANVGTTFDQIVADYRERLLIVRAPLLLLFIEIAGLALIYIAWTAAFQAEAMANEHAVLGARGAAIRQIVAAGWGQAVLLAGIAALLAIPLALLLLHGTAWLGPLAILARVQQLQLYITPEARTYVLAASAAGTLVLAMPIFPAARRSVTALRQQTARPIAPPFWQRSGLDLLIVAIAGVALVQLEQQGSLLQRLRGRFAVDPFLVVAPFLLLVAGALLYLRVYPWLLRVALGRVEHLRGVKLSTALTQLTRNRAASTHLVLLLSLTTALGLFTQTFAANLALNQRRQAGYLVGADGRATLRDSRPLLPNGLPAGVAGSWALRDTVALPGASGAPVAFLAIDPERFGSVAFNPPEHPFVPLPALLEALGPAPPPEGLTLPGRPRQLSLVLELSRAPYTPAAILVDTAGSFHHLQLSSTSFGASQQTFAAKIDLPAEAYPLRLVALGLLPTAGPPPPPDGSKLEETVPLVSLAVDGVVVETWSDSSVPWLATPDAPVDAGDPAAGTVELRGRDVVISRGPRMRAVMLRPNPQELAPVPVAVSEQYLRANNLKIGGTAVFVVRTRRVPVRIVATPAYYPSLGIDGAPFVVAHGPRLLRLLNTAFAPPLAPNELWLDLPGDAETIERLRRAPGIGTLLVQESALQKLSRDPLAVGIAGVFFLGFVTSLGLTTLGFAVALYLAGRRRTVEFAVLQSLGLGRRDILGILAIEQAILVGLALLAGTGLGALLGRLVLPLMAISDRGRAVVPPYLVLVPWGNLLLTYTVLIVLFAGVTIAVLWLLLRRGISGALRIGEA